jgi:putative transposase
MSTPRRRFDGAVTSFVSFSCAGGRSVFQRPENCELFISLLLQYRDAGEYKLHAFVVMPNHVHVLITPSTKLSRCVQLIRGRFSFELKKIRPTVFGIWNPGFTDQWVLSAGELLIRVNYIHQNPVRKRLCERADDYRFSSASGIYRMDEWKPATLAAVSSA